jgi:serine/threonine protein kinase
VKLNISRDKKPEGDAQSAHIAAILKENIFMTEDTGKQIGNYRVLRLLGSGGFAEVYLGEHVYLHTQAAIKLLTTRLAEDGLTSFQQEAQTIASLDHPNIVRVLDFGIQDQMPFLVMGYASGGTLRQHHPAGTRLTLLPIVDSVTQIANALQYAHDRKIIHRDLKPENVLMGADGTLLLSDFGMAVLSQSSRYQGQQEVGGTVAYMAPEQLQGQAVPASDQYALGIVVYEWLAGSRPFTGSFVEMCSQHLLTPPPSLRKLVPNLSPAVEDAVFLALSKDPQQRFQSVKAFANALTHALNDTHTFIKTKQATNEIPLDQSNVSTFVKTPSSTNPAWTPPPDQINGSSTLFVLIRKRFHAASKKRLRNSSKLPRPNIERFTNFKRLICPSTRPFLYGRIKEVFTAS